MFTGLVRALGEIQSITDTNGVRRFKVAGDLAEADLTLGASISHSGVCLTIVASDFSGQTPVWEVEAVPETLKLTSLGAREVGDRINLEPSLRLGVELGGHLVFGHVDGLGELIEIAEEGDSHRITIRPPEALHPLIAYKGSITIDGISLTVAHVADNGDFQIAVIPHTWEVTSLGTAKTGDKVNLEVDMLARYVERQLAFRKDSD